MSSNPNCRLCELWKSSKHVCIYGSGKGPAFGIGEAPGRNEANTGKTFTGESGQLLRRHLSQLGIQDIYLTNVVRCRPPDNRKPEPSEIKACRPYLEDEIEAQNPQAILLLGATAMRACIGRTKISEMNGQLVERNGRKFVCSFHPAYVLRDPSKEPQLVMALSRYADVLRGRYDNTMPDWRVVDRTSLDVFLKQWSAAKAFSFDVETTSLDWFKSSERINCINFSLSLSSESKGNWILPVSLRAVMPIDRVRDLLVWLIAHAKGKRCVAHNGKFDNLWLRAQFSLRFDIAADTMLEHHILDENPPHDLKMLARTFCSAPDYDIALKEKRGMVPGTWRKLFGYGGADAYYTLCLDEIFYAKMDSDERWLHDHLTIPAQRVLEAAEANGLYVDLKKMAEVERDQTAASLLVRNHMNRMAKRIINWNSPAQVADVLFNQLKLKPRVFTDKGQPSTSEESLIALTHPIVKMLEKYRTHQKFLSTYILGWKDFMDGPHLYLSTKLHGTVTGRYSSRLHQVPRDGTVRNLITAPPGWQFGQLDISQAELRTIAIVSRDPELLNCFANNIDVHWRTLMATIEMGGGEYVPLILKTARAISNSREKIDFPDALEMVRSMNHEKAIAIDKNWKEARKKAKGINFGFVFDQSPEGFIDYARVKYDFECTLDQSREFHGAFFTTYLRLRDWHERQRKLVRKDGYVQTMSGRKRHLPGIWARDRSLVAECERQAINSPIQGYIGDHKAMIMVELAESFDYDDFRIVGEVHDSILFWIRPDKQNKILREVKQRAENPRLVRELGLKFPIKMAVDIELGSWGAGQKWRES